MKVTVILKVIGALGAILKGFIKGLEDWDIRGQVENIHTTALLRLTRLKKTKKLVNTWGDLLSLKFLWETMS